jgi:short-subunit dehydrogenase
MSQRILLTGASRGIGVAIAEGLARRGAHLVLTARSEAKLEQTAERVKAAGGTSEQVVADLALADDRARLVEQVLAGGVPTAVVHNAGVEVPLAVVDQSPEQIDTQLQVNLHAPIQITRALLPAMVKAGRGAVAMVSSMSGKSPTPYNAVYTATKFGLNGFTASLRVELEGTGVHAGVVCPSFVADAGMWSDTGATAPAMVQEVPLDKVVKGVLAVLDGKNEVLVTTPLARPLLALTQLFPSVDRKVLGALGVLDTLKQRAELHRKNA